MKHDARSEGRGAGRKPRLEACKPKSRIKAGQFVTVFQDDGDVKLLPVSELLPVGLRISRFSVLARELVETFDPQYGYGPSPIAGRCAVQKYNGNDITFFGWQLAAPTGGGADQ